MEELKGALARQQQQQLQASSAGTVAGPSVAAGGDESMLKKVSV